MDTEKIKVMLGEVFAEVFGEDEAAKITESTQAKDVRGWDSLGHMNLLVAIEEKFDIRLSYSEIAAFNVVGDIIACLKGRLK